jgi:hypothetical protein
MDAGHNLFKAIKRDDLYSFLDWLDIAYPKRSLQEQLSFLLDLVTSDYKDIIMEILNLNIFQDPLHYANLDAVRLICQDLGITAKGKITFEIDQRCYKLEAIDGTIYIIEGFNSDNWKLSITRNHQYSSSNIIKQFTDRVQRRPPILQMLHWEERGKDISYAEISSVIVQFRFIYTRLLTASKLAGRQPL